MTSSIGDSTPCLHSSARSIEGPSRLGGLEVASSTYRHCRVHTLWGDRQATVVSGSPWLRDRVLVCDGVTARQSVTNAPLAFRTE
jgi:hypothetical protein